MSPGRARSAKLVNPASSQVERLAVTTVAFVSVSSLKAATTASSPLLLSTPSSGSASAESISICMISPVDTIVSRSRLPQKAPSAMVAHAGAMCTLAPMPAGAATSVNVPSGSPLSFWFRLYKIPFSVVKCADAMLPICRADSLVQREKTQAGTVANSSGSTAAPSIPSGTRRRLESSLLKSMPL